MEEYRTEEEQVEALRRWWDENGKSTIAAVVIALAGGFGWQAWQDYSQQQADNASDVYQLLLSNIQVAEQSDDQRQEAGVLAEQLKKDYPGSTYAQYAALFLARDAVAGNLLTKAEAELRWVLAKADAASETAQIAQLRLARVLAAKGDAEQALGILDAASSNTYRASYAVARGDILLGLGRDSEALTAYTQARLYSAEGGASVNLETLGQKIQALSPVPPRELAVPVSATVEASIPADDPAESGADDARIETSEEE